MKYLILSVLSIIPSIGFAQETVKTATLPEAVTKVADMRIEITIRQGEKVWRILIPSNNSNEGLAVLRSALFKAGIPVADRVETNKARDGGGKHAVLSLLGGNYVMIPQK